MKNWALAVLVVAALPAGAGTIVSVTGSVGLPAIGDGFNNGAEFVSWTMGSATYTDATISADLFVNQQIDPLASAYLLEGATIGTATVVASDTSEAISNTTPQFDTLFTGETLNANDTYFLVVVENNGSFENQINWVSSTHPVVTNTAATNGADGADPSQTNGNLPSSRKWESVGNNSFLYQVAGTDPVSSAPEPGTIGLVSAALGAGFLFRRRKA
jgi:hypothetical protein